MGRVSRDVCVSSFAGDDHNRWLAANAIDYGSDPLDMLIRAEEGKAFIPETGRRNWPYPGQDRTPYVEDPARPSTPDLYVGACSNCGGKRNRYRHCLVCNPKTPGGKPLAKDPPKKYAPDPNGRKGGLGA